MPADGMEWHPRDELLTFEEGTPLETMFERLAVKRLSCAPVLRGKQVIGVVTVAGPAIRLGEERMLALGPALVQAAAQVGQASSGSALFKRQA